MTATRSRVDHRSDVLLLVDSDTDPSAFAELYGRHVASVYRWLNRRMGPLAADLTAETFTRAWLHRHRLCDDRDGSALPWLLGIAGKLVADATRHDRVETQARERLGLSCALADEDGHDEVERPLSPRLMLERRLAELPAQERDAIDLRIIDELGYDELGGRELARDRNAEGWFQQGAPRRHAGVAERRRSSSRRRAAPDRNAIVRGRATPNSTVAICLLVVWVALV